MRPGYVSLCPLARRGVVPWGPLRESMNEGWLGEFFRVLLHNTVNDPVSARSVFW